MRGIKFRVWDKKNNHWLEPDFFCISLSGILWIFNDAEHLQQDEFDIQQYTGLKDKNGEEVYEGDIVHYLMGAIDMVGSVGWDTLNSCFAINANKDDETWHPLILSFAEYGYEVIGNVYENPELVNNDQE